MKPNSVKKWIDAFPASLRDKINANNPHALSESCDCPGEAIDMCLCWSSTKEKGDFWHGVHRALRGTIYAGEGTQKLAQFQAGFNLGLEAKAHLDQLSAEPARADEAPTHKPTPTMNYSNQPVATPTLVFGTDVADMNADQCISAIQSNNKSIKTLEETGISSPYITEKINGLKSANEVLTKRLDSFATAPTPVA